MGGTPGKANSLSEERTDTEPPRVSRIHCPEQDLLRMELSEAVEIQTDAWLGSWTTSPGNGFPEAIRTNQPWNDHIELRLSDPVIPGRTYHLHGVGSILDCSGNPLRVDGPLRFGLPVKPEYREILISEILFNPLPWLSLIHI